MTTIKEEAKEKEMNEFQVESQSAVKIKKTTRGITWEILERC